MAKGRSGPDLVSRHHLPKMKTMTKGKKTKSETRGGAATDNTCQSWNSNVSRPHSVPFIICYTGISDTDKHQFGWMTVGMGNFYFFVSSSFVFAQVVDLSQFS